jgi:hypothetical protein
MIMKSMKTLVKQKGYLMVVAMLLILVIGFLGTFTANIFFNNSLSSLQQVQSDKALYIAEAGIEDVTHELLTTTGVSVSCTTIQGTPIIKTFGAGQYKVTAVPSGSNCAIKSIGAIPTITSPLSKRTVTATILAPLLKEDGLLAGNNAGTNFTAARWDTPAVSSWNTITPSPALSTSINGIYLNSSTDGWLVGASLFAKWNGGSSFTQVAVPASRTYNNVTCFGSGSCHAVGDRQGANLTIADYTGTLPWTLATVIGAGKNNLKGVSCASASDCWATGDFGGGTVADNSFYHYISGTWTLIRVDAANGNGNSVTNSTYNSVFCSTASDCWAVASIATFAHYDGTKWTDYTQLPIAITPTTYNSVTCTSATDCWAVGDNFASLNQIWHWTGAFGAGGAWARDTTLSNATSYSIKSVNCFVAGNCWAVGFVTATTTPVIFRYSGGAWSVFPNPAGLPIQKLNAVGLIAGAGTVPAEPITAWAEAF